MAGTRNIISALILRIAPRLRFPQLFALTAGLFVLDLVIPDLIPFVDEIILGLATLLIGTWKAKKDEHGPETDDPTIIETEARVVEEDAPSPKTS